MNKNKEINLGTQMEDDTIIELYWNRSEQAIKETDKKYGRYLYTIAYNIIRNNMDCEECLNDTYLNTWNTIPPKRPTAFQAFLSKIMRNLALDRYKSNTADKRIPSQLIVSLDELDGCVDKSPTVDEEYMIDELSRLLNEFLHSMSRRTEFIFVSRYYYSDSISSIAKMLRVSESTIYRELANIRKSLKDYLEKEGYFNEGQS